MPLTRRQLIFSAVIMSAASAFTSQEIVRANEHNIISSGFHSRYRLGAYTNFCIYSPKQHITALPIISLHPLAGNAHSQMRPALLDALDAANQHRNSSTAPLALVTVDAGNTYFHPRTTGEDSAAMIIHELLPILTHYNISLDRIGMHGESMGGYGALRIGGLLGSGQCPAIAATGPAMWLHSADSAPGAFDNPSDFATYTLIGKEQQFSHTAITIDISNTDTFLPAVEKFIINLPHPPIVHHGSGGHSYAYFNRVARSEFSFLSTHL